MWTSQRCAEPEVQTVHWAGWEEEAGEEAGAEGETEATGTP